MEERELNFFFPRVYILYTLNTGAFVCSPCAVYICREEEQRSVADLVVIFVLFHCVINVRRTTQCLTQMSREIIAELCTSEIVIGGEYGFLACGIFYLASVSDGGF